jgi:hypothetical protein
MDQPQWVRSLINENVGLIATKEKPHTKTTKPQQKILEAKPLFQPHTVSNLQGEKVMVA